MNGKPHVFKRVTWIAHSLGSVISYNVISDIFSRCAELRTGLDAKGILQTDEDIQLKRNIEFVEASLHRFVTLGSPLEKIAFLFPNAMRPWSENDRTRFAQENGQSRWYNFFHIWDPVSGLLRNDKFFERVCNMHSKLWRIPGLAHTSYWRDPDILSCIALQAYGSQICGQPHLRFLPVRRAEIYRRITVFVSLITSIVAICLAIQNRRQLWDYACKSIPEWLLGLF